MNRLDRLISISRKITQNEDFSDTTGISDDEFIQHLNDAQDRIVSKINTMHPKIFVKQKTLTNTANNEEVSLPSDVYMQNRIILAEYNTSQSATTNFYPLKKGSIQERIDGLSGEPSFYIHLGNTLLLKPTPQGVGQIRVTYQKRLPKLDIRRGAIESVTATGGVISAIKLSESNTEAVLDASGLNEDNYLTVVNRAGVVKMIDIEYDSVDTDGTINLTGTHSYDEDTESIAVGDFVCRGASATHVSELQDMCERYLLAYTNFKILKQDSNIDSAEASQELLMLEDDIVAAYADPSSDVDYIPILDSQYLDPEDEVF